MPADVTHTLERTRHLADKKTLNLSASRNAPPAAVERPPSGFAVNSDTTLLALLLLLLAIPAAGLPLLLGFAGSTLASAAIAAAVIAGATAISIFRLGPAERIRTDLLLFTLAGALMLCVLAGEGRFFYANSDWITRDATINDMVVQPWPFVYRIDGTDFALRASLAMYMLPAAFGKIFGVYAAHLAMLAQNTVLFALIFYFLVPRHLTFAPGAAMVVIFVIFSGLDIVPEIGKYLVSGVWPNEQIERWATLFQYSSHITQLFWVPHHAIGGWSFACLFMLWRRGLLRASVLACAYLYIAFWSPFAVMGGAPFLLYAAIAEFRAGKIDRFDIIIAPLAALPTPLIWLYLLQNSGAVGHTFMVSFPGFWHTYFAFILIEFIPYVWLIVKLRPAMLKQPDFLIVVASLLLIPFYKWGASDDFAMRASIPALAVLAASFSIMLVETADKYEFRVWTRVATAILMTGAVTGGMEIGRALATAPLPISRCDLVEAWNQSEFHWLPQATYLVKVDAMPGWMRPQAPAEVRSNPAVPCWSKLLNG